MAKRIHTQKMDGKTIKFGLDKVKKELSLDEDYDCHDLVQAIAEEFKHTTGDDYPLGPCLNTDEGRQLNLAPGWTFKDADKGRVKNASVDSNFQ